MAIQRQFSASVSEVFPLLVESARALHRVRDKDVDPEARTLKFETKVRLLAGGSGWVVTVKPLGPGCIAAADARKSVTTHATDVMADVKKVEATFDGVEQDLARTSPHQPRETLEPLVMPEIPKKREHFVPEILSIIAAAEAAGVAGDSLAEELFIARVKRVAAGAGLFDTEVAKWGPAEIEARIAAGRLRRGVELVATVGENLTVMNDRAIQVEKGTNNQTVHALDDEVSASVEVNGQIITTSRPSLTRMAIGSVLPGSALLVGLALPKAVNLDGRKASLVLKHPQWRLTEAIDPDGADEVGAVAAQINLLLRPAGSEVTQKAAPSAVSLGDELAKLAGLHRDGVLTDDEFTSAKARLLAG